MSTCSAQDVSLRGAQPITQGRELVDICCSGVGHTGANRPEGAREMRHRIGVTELRGLGLQLRGCRPLAPFDDVTRGTGRQRKRSGIPVRVVGGHGDHLVDDPTGVVITTQLQVGIDHIVGRVQLIIGLVACLGQFRCGAVRSDDSFQ